RRSPAWPNGASRDCGSPVPKPSREIEKLWILVCDIEFDPSVIVDSRRAGIPVVTLTPEEPAAGLRARPPQCEKTGHRTRGDRAGALRFKRLRDSCSQGIESEEETARWRSTDRCSG